MEDIFNGFLEWCKQNPYEIVLGIMLLFLSYPTYRLTSIAGGGLKKFWIYNLKSYISVVAGMQNDEDIIRLAKHRNTYYFINSVIGFIFMLAIDLLILKMVLAVFATVMLLLLFFYHTAINTAYIRRIESKQKAKETEKLKKVNENENDG